MCYFIHIELIVLLVDSLSIEINSTPLIILRKNV